MLWTIIDGVVHERDAVLAWEDRRMAAVRKRLGLARSSAPRDIQRKELLERKLALGHSGLRKLLGRKLWLSEKIARVSVAVSGKSRRFSVCEIEVARGSAAHFAKWFMDLNTVDGERAMLDACPDHYIITPDQQGRQIVVETTGGSPLPGEFTFDVDDISTLLTTADPSYPVQIAGVARLRDGLAIGGVRHQFREEGDGFRALLTVEFPGSVPAYMIAEHRWHLAVEFSNWIEAASAEDG
ncbi:MAG: hypothetical protein KF730_06550 [Sphingomonas sp.]|uniref:hypothetical protein n=1 Tax=Sphingomonas sp. TaxID=28214 RepID=UPI0025DB941B|nr:hypothetical protein [Sphingomonas sp.]MBX3564223.1 hypothetical protein [Sphingomonas sp.]